MATQIEKTYDQSLLSMAAYANDGSFNSLVDIGFDEAQAADFILRYEYVKKITDTPTGSS